MREEKSNSNICQKNAGEFLLVSISDLLERVWTTFLILLMWERVVLIYLNNQGEFIKTKSTADLKGQF